MNDREWILEVEDVAKAYTLGTVRLEVLRNIRWQVRRGEWAALLGASGSGKTTLLNLLGALERPDRGRICAAGTDYRTLSGRRAAVFRNRKIGCVLQSYCLLPELSVLENVMLPARMAGTAPGMAAERARELLVRVGLGDRLRHRPGELSGGEQQRASIARALINDPELLLADEPTGNLDAATGEEILALFQELRQSRLEGAMIMITHNEAIARRADSAMVLRNGVLTAG